MSVHDRVLKSFQDALDFDSKVDVGQLRYREFPAWTSVGHMILVAALESEFDTMLETDDILAMSSFDKAVEIMTRYADA